MSNKFNPLLDSLPGVCVVGEHTYTIATDYRIVLAYLRLMAGDDEDDDKAILGLSLFFGDQIARNDIQELLDYMQWYIRRGRKEEVNGNGPASTFDILEDSGRIYAAFLQTYKIDLRKAKLHWWIFGELLESLPRGTHLADVIDIRGRKFEKWMKPADKNELQRIKDQYRIGEKRDAMAPVFDMLRGIAR